MVGLGADHDLAGAVELVEIFSYFPKYFRRKGFVQEYLHIWRLLMAKHVLESPIIKEFYYRIINISTLLIIRYFLPEKVNTLLQEEPVIKDWENLLRIEEPLTSRSLGNPSKKIVNINFSSKKSL